MKPRRKKRPCIPMALVTEVTERFTVWHCGRGGRVDDPDDVLKSSIRIFLFSGREKIAPDTQGVREVFRGVLRARAAERAESNVLPEWLLRPVMRAPALPIGAVLQRS